VTRWAPKTYGEWFAAFRLYWQTLRGSLAYLRDAQQVRATEILLSRSRELLQIEDLRGEIFDTLIELSGSSEIDNRKIISTVEDILSYDIEGILTKLRRKL
jgi:hypothetical protein